MPTLEQHPILRQSFAVIDAEFGPHQLSPAAYAIARRVIHSTADFEFKQLLHCSDGAIESGIAALQRSCPIVVDVSMVRQGVATLVGRTWHSPLITAVELAESAAPGQTRTETGMDCAWQRYPEAVFVVGNAPTALARICDRISTSGIAPPLIIGAPVGFIGVEAAKQRLAELSVPQIRVEGRKGGSSVAAAILNALLVLAWERS